MRARVRLAFIVAAALLAAGCYESKVPLASAPSGGIDPRLLGHWREGIEDPEGADDLLIIQFDDRHAYGEFLDSAGEEPGRFRLYTVTVGGVPLLNAQVIGGPDEKGSYSFFRFDFGADSSLSLRMVSDRLIKTPFKTSRELYDFVRRHLDDGKLYEDSVRFVRVGDS